MHLTREDIKLHNLMQYDMHEDVKEETVEGQ